MQGSPRRPDGRGVPEIGVTDLKDALERGEEMVLVDVREPFEREIADLPEVGQLRIPVGELDARVRELDPGDRIVLYCRTGARSAWATELLRARGYDGVLNLRGGLMAWRDQVDSTLPAY